MKEKELRKHATCSFCQKPILADGLPFFYTVRIERHGVKLDAVGRQQGLTMLLGGSAGLAQVMGSDEEMTIPMMDPVNLTVCESCSTDREHCVALMAEAPGDPKS